MSTITLKIQKEIDLKEFKDHMLGSGGTRWSWWVKVEEIKEPYGGSGISATWHSDIDRSEQQESGFCTWQEIADACSKLAETHSLVAQQLINDDFDADGSDCVLQYAFIGEIRYG